ncbi:wall-associated receptor kinase 2-like [Syzygium oleosum]|uniref:wall-associated receptor kinase 2-like n=1 Tax=Syzygium oleosum TaxID=219896 RepID=UPI0024BB2569|nr:wall-associated receptor kinase 2-like [Syzygium oleosum]
MKVVHWLLMVAVAWWLRQGGAPPVPGNCEHQCGAVPVPFPFGLETNCARSSDFLLDCTNTEGSVIQLQWGNLTIRKISVGDSTMVVSLPEVYQCYDQNGQPANNSNPLIIDLSTNPRYRFSDTQNKLTVLGCDTMTTVTDKQGKFGSGCISYCSENVDLAKETTCSGRGCCQASIPKGLQWLNISISPLDQKESAWRSNYCALAFVADNRSFNVSGRTLPRFEDVGKGEDLVLDWMVEPDVNCLDATKQRSYACGKNTDCKDFGNGTGYRCVCKPGYYGNPYSPFEGCKDIDECKEPQKYPCHGKCRNTPGNYTCHCRPGKRGKGKERCQASPSGIGFGVMAVSVFGVTVTASMSLTMRWKLRRINFRRNGGEILEQQGVQIFPEAKLAEATNNYDDSNKLRDDDFGSVHKGNIVGDDIVVVRKPKDAHKSQIKGDYQRELEFLMKRSHKNVVKLKGICLETKIPLLVYEYIPNGTTLFEHIHQDESTILKSWGDRFRIAAEAALALNYMHSSIKPPIVHGNIKSANIFLDQNFLDQSYSAKVSDVGTSVLFSPKHRHIVATQKQDSLGYIDPAYLITGTLTTKSDVYSFGVILAELLTRKELFTESGDSISMIHRFISSVKGNALVDLVDFEGASDDEMKRVEMVAEIAVECLDQSRANRPAMREVARRLAAIHLGSAFEEVEDYIEETGYGGDAQKPPPFETSACGEACERWMSNCLSCLGVD